MGGGDCRRRAKGVDDQVDRAVLEMKPPAVRKEPDLRALCAVHGEAFNRSVRLDRPGISIDLPDMPLFGLL